MSLGPIEIAERIGAAVVLGALVGIERELRDKSAGVLTHAMLSLGACAFALVSVDAFPKSSDPSRLAAQIVSGIGFLGAGTIIRSGGTVRGLTTAASLWVTAAVGTACGVGYIGPGAGVAFAAVLSLVILRGVKTQLRKRIGNETVLSVSTKGLESDISSILKVVGDSAVRVVHVDIRRDEDGDGRMFGITVDSRQDPALRVLIENLTSIQGVERVEMDDGRP